MFNEYTRRGTHAVAISCFSHRKMPVWIIPITLNPVQELISVKKLYNFFLFYYSCEVLITVIV